MYVYQYIYIYSCSLFPIFLLNLNICTYYIFTSENLFIKDVFSARYTFLPILLSHVNLITQLSLSIGCAVGNITPLLISRPIFNKKKHTNIMLPQA